MARCGAPWRLRAGEPAGGQTACSESEEEASVFPYLGICEILGRLCGRKLFVMHTSCRLVTAAPLEDSLAVLSGAGAGFCPAKEMRLVVLRKGAGQQRLPLAWSAALPDSDAFIEVMWTLAERWHGCCGVPKIFRGRRAARGPRAACGLCAQRRSKLGSRSSARRGLGTAPATNRSPRRSEIRP